MKKTRGLVASVALAVVVACSADHEETEHTGESREALTATASADATIKGGTPDKNFGTATTLHLQQVGPNRALVRFTDADVASFSSGTSVGLELTIASIGDNWNGSTGRFVALHRLTHDWDETHATWQCSMDSNTANSSTERSASRASPRGTASSTTRRATTRTTSSIASVLRLRRSKRSASRPAATSSSIRRPRSRTSPSTARTASRSAQTAASTSQLRSATSSTSRRPTRPARSGRRATSPSRSEPAPRAASRASASEVRAKRSR